MKKSILNIKICGITRIETLKFLIKTSVNYYGLIFYKKSPRYIDLIKAKSLTELTKNTDLQPVGVFVDYPINKIQKYIEQLKLKNIQLHGKENNIYIKKIKKNNNIRIFKSIGINKLDDLNLIKNFSNADYLIFDYKPKKINELPGGNAKKFNWNILKNSKITKKWFLSGGINEKNVTEAINSLNPYGIDLSSSVEEKPGIKSIEKISNFLKIVNKNK